MRIITLLFALAIVGCNHAADRRQEKLMSSLSELAETIEQKNREAKVYDESKPVAEQSIEALMADLERRAAGRTSFQQLDNRAQSVLYELKHRATVADEILADHGPFDVLSDKDRDQVYAVLKKHATGPLELDVLRSMADHFQSSKEPKE
jgi:hypothetical protein